MRNTNYCVVVGRVANEMNETNFRSVGNGTPLVTFSVAVNGSENVNGQWQDVASFFDVSYFGAGAGALRNFTGFGKGALVCVSGALKQRRWKDQNGNNRSAVEIVATSVEFLRAPNNGQSTQQQTMANGYGNYNAISF